MRHMFIESGQDALHILLLVALVAIPSSILLGHLHTRYEISQAGYDIAKVTRTHRKLMEENKKLSIEAAVLGRTERMSDMARERFGLAPTKPEQVYILSLDAPAKSPQHAQLVTPAK